MQVTITNQNGEIFAEHDLGPVAASQLHKIIEHAQANIPQDDEDVVHDLLHTLESAADNVRIGAVTDDTNLIVSEKGVSRSRTPTSTDPDAIRPCRTLLGVPLPPGELPGVDRTVDGCQARRGHPRAAVPLPPDHLPRRPADRGRHASILRRSSDLPEQQRRSNVHRMDAPSPATAEERTRGGPKARLRDAAGPAGAPQPADEPQPNARTVGGQVRNTAGQSH